MFINYMGELLSMEQKKGEKIFHGKCYVFDNRIVKEINKINPTVISKCLVTEEKNRQNG